LSHRKVPLERLEQLWDSERSLTTQQADERRAQFGTNDIVESAERVATFPFTEDRKRETAIIRRDGGQLTVASKGAAEVILSMCRLTDDERNAWQAKIKELAAGAHKVIAVASRTTNESIDVSREPDRDFDFEGLLAFEDPVREGVREAIRACQVAGIHPIMVTGDHPLTAHWGNGSCWSPLAWLSRSLFPLAICAVSMVSEMSITDGRWHWQLSLPRAHLLQPPSAACEPVRPG
jgi:hypothetical protein